MEPQTGKRLSELLRNALTERGLTAERLGEQTGIAERHIDSLLKGTFEKLPAAPYVRGYLGKLAPLVGMESQELWRLYREELAPKSSGPLDRLPSNRYVIRSRVSRRTIALGAIAVIIVVYLSFNLNRLIGQPPLRIEYPFAETITVDTDTVMLTGAVDPRDTLSINGEEIPVDAEGRFEKSQRLEPGLNTMVFSVKRLLGREITETRRVIYELPAETPAPSPGEERSFFRPRGAIL